MAILRSNYYVDKAFILGCFSLMLLIGEGSAYEFKVGGSRGWSVTPDDESYYPWAEKNRFQIGDSLLFVYPKEKDAVLQVTKENYNNCTTEKPLAKYTDGHTVFKLNQSGPFYFVGGIIENCLKNNQKLQIIVLADHGNSSSQAPPPANDKSSSPPHAHGGSSSPPHAHGGSPSPPNAHGGPPHAHGGSSSTVITSMTLLGFTIGLYLVSLHL